MLVNLHLHMQRLFDVRHRPAHIQQQPVGMLRRHRQTIGLGKGDDRLIILLRRTKLLRELFRRQDNGDNWGWPGRKFAGADWPSLLIAQRQADGQIQLLRACPVNRGAASGRCGRHVNVYPLPFRRLNRQGKNQYRNHGNDQGEQANGLEPISPQATRFFS